MNKAKLLLKQMGIGDTDGQREYKVVETSDARWECGEILNKSYVKELCRKQKVRIIQGI